MYHQKMVREEGKKLPDGKSSAEEETNNNENHHHNSVMTPDDCNGSAAKGGRSQPHLPWPQPLHHQQDVLPKIVGSEVTTIKDVGKDSLNNSSNKGPQGNSTNNSNNSLEEGEVDINRHPRESAEYSNVSAIVVNQQQQQRNSKSINIIHEEPDEIDDDGIIASSIYGARPSVMTRDSDSSASSSFNNSSLRLHRRHRHDEGCDIQNYNHNDNDNSNNIGKVILPMNKRRKKRDNFHHDSIGSGPTTDINTNRNGGVGDSNPARLEEQLLWTTATTTVGNGNNTHNTNLQEEEEQQQREEKKDGYDDVRAAFEKEHKVVREFKVIVVIVLVAAAIAVSTVVYRFTSNGERQNMQDEYNDYASKFITNFHHVGVMRQYAAYTAAAQFTARSIDDYGPEKRPWPNATLPDFHDLVRGILVLGHGTSIEFSPLFPNDDTIRREWEAYAVENEALIRFVPEWAQAEGYDDHVDMIDHSHGHSATEFDDLMSPDMTEALAIANGKRLLRGRRLQDRLEDETTINAMTNMTSTLKPYDYGDCTAIGGASTEMLPPSWGGTNDMFEHPSRPLEEGIYTMDGMGMVDETNNASQMPYLAPSWQIYPPIGNEGRVMYNEYSNCHRRRAINTMIKTGGPAMSEVLIGFEDFHVYFDQPSGILFYPVHDHFEENKNRTLVGFVTITFNWLGTFWNILPGNIRGIVAIIETSTGQKTSFRVDGKFGEFIGEGDFHNHKWDQMRRSSSIYRVYAKENDAKELSGHRRDLRRYLDELESDFSTGNVVMGSDEEHQDIDTLVDGEHIDYRVHIYPSDDFEACYLTSQPKIFALAVSLLFLGTVISFIIYDVLVEKRQKKLLENAERSGKVVASLFPAMVRERLFTERQSKDEERNPSKTKGVLGWQPNMNVRGNMRGFLAGSDSDTATSISCSGSPPIADLYNDTTVMFADIAGFTAWSSEREPAQVFQLLESLFSVFDAEAKSMKVFKVETIGDCYVAVTGLPESTPDHAVIMAKFAQRCLVRFNELTKELELSLGPGTADLGIRIGLHSGPVTAGVLRGEKARFQLFGDTMNTSSRMESTSIKNMIQVTEETASLLQKSGKGHTLIAREGLIKAKGKGYMQTYWLRPKSSQSTASSNFSDKHDFAQVSQNEVDHIHLRAQHHVARAELGLPSLEKSLINTQVTMPQELDHSWNDTGFIEINKRGSKEGLQRLIKWNTAVLESILIKIVLQRNYRQKQGSFRLSKHDFDDNLNDLYGIPMNLRPSESAVFHEEIATAVKMPHFDRAYMSAACLMPSNEEVNLIPRKAREELRGYVARIASMYQDVHFHSFEHASHVTMSARKLINKVVLRNATEFSSLNSKHGEKKKGEKDLQKRNEEADLFFSTYGLASDPLAQFAVVFAALVHDVDHRGVPNVQLIKENPKLSMKYKNKSVAENNSIYIAWSELLKPEFANLRRCMFLNDDDETRFRQLLINVVIATDITDKERRMGEKERWQAAFLSNGDDFNWEREWQNKSEDELPDVDISLKATVVLEQIVLASDVAHTMQHWLTYVKWNERLYKEMWAAYATGRAEKDPTEGWYMGEIGFFDGYIIPLATKLKECGVFGNAGDEYLGNALRNKTEWIEKGQKIVAEFEAKIKRKSDIDASETGTSDKSTSSSSHSKDTLMHRITIATDSR